MVEALDNCIEFMKIFLISIVCFPFLPLFSFIVILILRRSTSRGLQFRVKKLIQKNRTICRKKETMIPR